MIELTRLNGIHFVLNEDLIESLVEEDKEKTNEKLQKFLKNYSSLASNVLDEKTKKVNLNSPT